MSVPGGNSIAARAVVISQRELMAKRQLRRLTRARRATLRNAKGIDMVVYAGGGKRFNELSDATYSEAVAVSVRKERRRHPKSQGACGRRPAVQLPWSTIYPLRCKHLTAPSLAVKGTEGRTMSLKVRDKEDLQNLKWEELILRLPSDAPKWLALEPLRICLDHTGAMTGPFFLEENGKRPVWPRFFTPLFSGVSGNSSNSSARG